MTVEELEAERSAALTALHEIKQWVDAYPETIFRPLSKDDLAIIDMMLKANNFDMGALHAQWARHILGGLSQIIEKALEPKD